MGVDKLIPWLEAKGKEAGVQLVRPDFKETVPNLYILDGAGALQRALHQDDVSAARMFSIFMSDAERWCATVRLATHMEFTLVIVMDKPQHVSATKAEEQAERRARLNREAEAAKSAGTYIHFPPDFEFHDEVDPLGAMVEPAAQRLYNGLSIRHQPHATRALINYFEDRLRTHPLPDNVALCVDFHDGRAFRRVPDELSDGPAYGRHRPRAVSYLCTPYESQSLGEGEIACVYYAVQLARPGDVVAFRTDDTDIVPIAYSAASTVFDAKGIPLQWVYRKGQDDWFDLTAVFKVLRTQLHMTPELFVYYCAFRGCDHVNKKAVSDRLKTVYVEEKFVEFGMAMEALAAEAKSPADLPPIDVEELIAFVNPKLSNRDAAYALALGSVSAAATVATADPAPKKRRLVIAGAASSASAVKTKAAAVERHAPATSSADAALAALKRMGRVNVAPGQLENLRALQGMWCPDWSTYIGLPFDSTGHK
jgi:hypothetical protein